MVLFTAGPLEWGLALILATVFVEYAKLRTKAERGWGFLIVAGVLFLFAGIGYSPSIVLYGTEANPGIFRFGSYTLGTAFEVIGWFFALIGIVLVFYEMLFEK